MAVVRITAPARWHRLAAEATKGNKRLSRELARAAERYGLTAEIQGDEARSLVECLPGDQRAIQALCALEASELRERARPRARDIALGLAKMTRS